MGKRVTFRTRPRIDSFWATRDPGTSTDFAASAYLGPFTNEQMIELWFRAKEIRFQASADWEDDTVSPPDTGTATLDVTLVRVLDSDLSEITDENDLIGEWGGQNTLRFHLTSGNVSGDLFVESPIVEDLGVQIDENDKYWLVFVNDYPLLVIDGDQNLQIRSAATSDTDKVTTNLTFSDSTTAALSIAFEVYNATSISNLSCTIEITKWFPYADKAGSAAWDVDTGLQVNGGPGG